MSSAERIIIALGSFAGGLAVGLLFAPSPGQRTRRVARVGAHKTGRWLSHQVKATQQNIVEVGDEAADRLRKAAGEVVQKYVPDIVGDDAEWQEAYARTAKEVEDEKR